MRLLTLAPGPRLKEEGENSAEWFFEEYFKDRLSASFILQSSIDSIIVLDLTGVYGFSWHWVEEVIDRSRAFLEKVFTTPVDIDQYIQGVCDKYDFSYPEVEKSQKQQFVEINVNGAAFMDKEEYQKFI